MNYDAADSTWPLVPIEEVTYLIVHKIAKSPTRRWWHRLFWRFGWLKEER